MHGEKFPTPPALYAILSHLPGGAQADDEKTFLLDGTSNVGQPPPPYYGGVTSVPYTPKASNAIIQMPKGDWKPCQSKRNYEGTNWQGIFLAFLSGAFFTLSSAAVKALRSLDPMELLVVRATVQVLVMLPFACKSGQPMIGPKGYRCLLQLQGFVGGVTLVLLFITFRRLPLGDATTIIFSSPVCVMILSFIFLREPCGFFRTFIVFLLVTGVVLIAKPPFIFILNDHRSHHYDLGGYLCAISATVFTALNMVVMRKCKAVHFSLIVLHLSAWSLLSAGAVLLIRHRGFRPDWVQGVFYAILPHGWWQSLLVVCVSAFGLAGQVLVARALGLEGAGKVAVTRSLDIVLAFILQVFVFGEIPDWLSILGALFVLLCVIAMGLEEQIINFSNKIP